jgi:hypothetical protein
LRSQCLSNVLGSLIEESLGIAVSSSAGSPSSPSNWAKLLAKARKRQIPGLVLVGDLLGLVIGVSYPSAILEDMLLGEVGGLSVAECMIARDWRS